VLAC